MSHWIENRHRSHDLQYEISKLPVALRSVHASIPEYSPTPLIELPNLAGELDVGAIFVKDESHRFGLKAFKALGATYAIFKLMRDVVGETASPRNFYSDESPLKSGRFTFTTATDGNHGRGVAWVARKLRQNAVIYMPENTVPARVENIQSEGAEVIVVDGDYDHAVELCKRDAEKQGRLLISDTSWTGYEAIPRWIQHGYFTLFDEAVTSAGKDSPFDVVIVPGGVGALAASAAMFFRSILRDENTRLVSVEPVEAACLLESAATETGESVKAGGSVNSIMAGLNCGTPSLVAWPSIRAAFDAFLAIEDSYSERAMRMLYHPKADDPRIISGESGAASMAALLALRRDERLANACDFLGLGSGSRVLILNTEGDTDPVNFESIVARFD